MEESDKNKKTEGPESQGEDKLDFIQEFIERKKLQNRILQVILDKIKKAEQNNLSQTTSKKKRP
jgi:hypothetical protein